MGSVNNSVENHGNNSGFWVGINQGHIHLASGSSDSCQNLLIAEGAAYDAHENEQLGCLPGARTEILDSIQEWAKSAPRECIFWLNGGAGTGKSSIAFEAARILDEARLLGASFFFKRAGGDRGNAKRLFPTLAQQLAEKVPRLQPLVARAIAENPDIGKKALREQWNHLILQPLLGLEPNPKPGPKPDPPAPIVIVIDALDECDSDMHRDDVRTILQLLPQVQRQESVPIRFLVVSRPEHSIQLVFNRLNCSLRILNLNNIRPEQIDRDISTFLEHALTDIRDGNQLSSSWPGDGVLQKIVQRTSPLFIAAVTLCRFIADSTWDPEDRLEEVLADRNEHVSKMAEVYLPILKRLLQGKSISETQTLVRDFKNITGAIVLLAEPLPCDALAELLGININKIRTQLSRLYSVLDCRDLAQPVRFLHISFRDYVLDRETKVTQSSQKFWIDKKEVHQNLAMQCLRVMNMSLHKNICQLDSIRRSNLDSTRIDNHLPLQLGYACRYWTYHLSRSHSPDLLLERAFSFLQVHFLHWAEALSLQGLVYKVAGMLDSLQFFLTNGQHPPIHEFLDDARRFILRNARLADCAPLQLYSSGLMFLPRNSIIRRRFFRGLASGIQISGIEDSWGAHVLTTEHDHLSIIIAIAMSSDGKILASATSRDEICIWDTATGRPQHFFEVPGHITCLEILPNNRTLACGHEEGYVSIWALETGDSYRVFDGWSGPITRMAFSADGLLLASLSGRDCIEVWNLATGARRILLSYGYDDHYIAFSSTGVLLMACSYRSAIDFWNPATGKHLRRVKFGSHGCSPRGFSPDGKLMAAEEQGRIGILDLEKNALCGSLPQYSRPPQDVVFLSGEILAALFNDNTIMLFNAQSGCTQVIKHGSVNDLLCMALPTDGKSFVFCSKSLINFWDLTAAPSSQQSPGELIKNNEPTKPDSQNLHCLVFSPDGKWIASSSRDGVNLWDGITGDHYCCLREREYPVEYAAMAFSPDGCHLVVTSIDEGIIVYRPLAPNAHQDPEAWRMERPSGKDRRTLRDFAERGSTCLGFSPTGELLAVNLADHLFIIWNLSSSEPQHIAHRHGWSKGRAELGIAFAPDGRLHIFGCAYDAGPSSMHLKGPGPDKPRVKLKVHRGFEYDFRDRFEDSELRIQLDTAILRTVTGWGQRPIRCLVDSATAIWAGGKTLVSISRNRKDERCWICIDGNKHLLLLAESIPRSAAWKDGTLALGHRSGKITLLSFPG